MADVLPLDPAARRRAATHAAARRERLADRPADRPLDRTRERTTDRPGARRPAGGTERVVPLPVHREEALASRSIVAERALRPRAAATAGPSEGELARVYFPLVLLVALLDLATKAFAVAGLEGTIALGGPFALHLVHNTASAGGVWLGAQTRELNVMATGVVIGLLTMLVPTLARLDRQSTVALALMAGGGVGNLASLVASARGVPDFIAVRHAGGAWVLNVADLFMLAGLLMLGRTVLLLARAVRTQGARTPAARARLTAA